MPRPNAGASVVFRRGALGALILVALGAAARAAVQQSTFSSANRTVAVYATVTDANVRLVPDLARDDFEIYDNGKRQPLSVFSNDIQPITLVMLLDRSGSMRANFALVEKAAEAFVAEMSPGDKARVGSFSNRIEVDPRDFTSNHGELLDILRTDLQEEGPTPLWNAINVGITALDQEQGRRVILVFTDGADNPGNGRANNTSLNDVMKRADEENVMVYAIGLAGNNSGFGSGNGGGFGGGRRGGVPGSSRSGAAFEQRGFGRGSGGGGGNRAGASNSDHPDPGLAKLASATGGGYFELMPSDDMSGTFKRVADELHHQYALGFAAPTLDGKRHTIDVRVLVAGMTARARKSYVAERP